MEPTSIYLIAGLSMGWAMGLALALLVWFVMDRRITSEREARDRAVDIMTQATARTPITTIGIAEEARSENEDDEQRRRVRQDFEAMYADEVGDEDPSRDPRLGASADLGGGS